MERFDFKTISVAIGSEDRFNARFSVFGWELVTSQSFYSDEDSPLYGSEMDMAHYYEASQVDYALAGIDLNGAKARVPSYIRISYRRNRLDHDYHRWIEAERDYNRITFDMYRLYAKARESHESRHLPLWLLLPLLALFLLGCASFAAGYLKNGASKTFGASLAATALWGGLYLAVIAFSVLLVLLIVWRVLKDGATARNRRYARDLYDIKTVYRKSLRNGDFPSCPLDAVKAIEREAGLDVKKRPVKKPTDSEGREIPEEEELLFA